MENSRSELKVKDRRPDALGELRILPDELICAVLEYLCPRDVARLACVSSAMYIFCNEEPLWMRLCLHNTSGQLEYKGSWKKTLLHGLNLPNGYVELCGKPLHFDGFNSLFLYRRLYRCFTTLDAFSLDNGKLERKTNISFEEFHHKYDGQKPVLLTNLADSWPARSTWTTEQLLLKYRDTAFKISQRSSRKITMKFKDYITYIKLQHDEDPLYIFDDKFGEVAPDLLKEYSVPHLFREDYFDVLGRDQRPPFRWLIIGPERSGASWHVDPALTSAWNTLLCGRKRWALYPPGRVPLGVTVHVNEEDGDVNVETPSSLQWWLDIYPLLAEEDKPIECTQFPGETIFVPSGWWHCVLNLETTVAVTQNFVNSKNFEFVCLDMAPGHCHKGVCRAGLLAVDKGSSLDNKSNISLEKSHSSYSDMSRKKRPRISSEKDPCVGNNKNSTEGTLKDYTLQDQDSCYSIDLLSSFLDEERDHYNALWSASNSIGQRELREWLQKLWIGKPEIRELIWKGACLALNVDKWSARVAEICTYHGLLSPFDDETLPVGTGSNPVYLIGDYVIKIYVEGGLMPSVHGLGTELEFYSHLHKFNSPLKDHIPDVLASGILSHENGSYTIVPWDGKSVPHLIAKCNLRSNNFTTDGFPFGVWSKSLFANREAGIINESASYSGHRMIWPFIITKRCKGNLFAHLRDSLLCENVLDLASFLGDQLRNLHLLPLPSLPDIIRLDIEQKVELPSVNASMETASNRYIIPLEWKHFIEDMNRRKKEITTRLKNWGHPIPDLLIEKVEEYIPDELAALLNIFKDDNGINKSCKFSAWIHSDIMEDNIFLEPCLCLDEKRKDVSSLVNGSTNGHSLHGECIKWHPSHIIDFSDLSIGDRICDLIPIYLDVFRGDSHLLEHFLESYKLPLVRKTSNSESDENWDKFGRLSYHAMCYCILHEDDILGAIFSLWKELRTAKSWEEVEETVWGKLNHFKGYN